MNANKKASKNEVVKKKISPDFREKLISCSFWVLEFKSVDIFAISLLVTVVQNCLKFLGDFLNSVPGQQYSGHKRSVIVLAGF